MTDEQFMGAEIIFKIVLILGFFFWQFTSLSRAKRELAAKRKREAELARTAPAE